MVAFPVRPAAVEVHVKPTKTPLAVKPSGHHATSKKDIKVVSCTKPDYEVGGNTMPWFSITDLGRRNRGLPLRPNALGSTHNEKDSKAFESEISPPIVTQEERKEMPWFAITDLGRQKRGLPLQPNALSIASQTEVDGVHADPKAVAEPVAKPPKSPKTDGMPFFAITDLGRRKRGLPLQPNALSVSVK